MLLPIKLATGKQPAKKQKVQKDLGLVITPEMQKNIEATNPQGIVERAKQIEAVRAEQEQFAQRTKQGQAQLAYEQTLKQAAQQPKQAKAFVPKLQELEKQISPPPVSREVVMQKRVPKTPEGLATISILTDYGTTTYTATPEETQILEFGTIDEGAALRNRLRQEAQAEFASQGLKKKRQTAEAYVTDKVNAALNPNFVNDQVAETLRAELDDTIFDFAAKYSPGGKLLKTGRDALKSASVKLKNVDDVGAQVTAGLIDSIINPVSSFATATANVYDPTATQEERVGAAGNIALYALGALPVTEAVGASVRAFKTGADVAEGLSLAARSLLRSTAPGRFIARKVTINDLVNVLERNGQMGGKTRGQLAREFASGGKAFAKATGQAPELFYNKYLNDLADQAQPATPAQFDVTAPKAPEIPTQVEDLGTVVDDLVSKTEPIVPASTIVEESDLEKLFQETVAPTLTPVKATRTRKPKTETVQPTPPVNEDLGTVVDELTTQVEPPVITEPVTPVVEPSVSAKTELTEEYTTPYSPDFNDIVVVSDPSGTLKRVLNVRGVKFGSNTAVVFDGISQFEIPFSQIFKATPEEAALKLGTRVREELPQIINKPVINEVIETPEIVRGDVPPFDLPLHQMTFAEAQKYGDDIVPKSDAVIKLENKIKQIREKQNNFIDNWIKTKGTASGFDNNALWQKLVDEEEKAISLYNNKRGGEIDKAHYNSIKERIESGKNVPTEVLADYPDLVKLQKEMQSKPVVTEPTAPVVKPSIAQEPEPIVPKTSVNTTPEELADPNVSVTQVPFKLDWTDKTSAENSTNYLQGLKNLFEQNGELGIENIDDLPLLAVSSLHEAKLSSKLRRAPINNKTPLPSSVYQKSIEELTYGEFKNMDWRLVPDTEANQKLIELLKQREEAFNRMVSHFKSNPGKGTTPQWKKVEELLKSRNNVIDPNDTELMDAMWQLWSETSVVSEANVMLNRLYGSWFDKEKLRLFGRETKTKRATPGTLEQFADDQLEGLQKSWKEARSKMGANIQPEHFEFVARAVAYVISKTGLKLADALVETSKYLKQKFNFDITFDAEDIANIENKLRELNISFEVSPPPVAPVAVSPTTSKSTAPPPPTEPTVTGIPETPEPITSGISNKANLSSEELGLISEAPQGKGRSATQVVEETINRNPSDKELEILAGKVANGQALNADDTATLLVGQGRFNLKVFNAREALDNAIKSGASAQDIDQLRDAWLLAQADATNFAKQIQRGKSGWSDVGRVLQQKTDLFTGELSQIKANIIAEAELRKGRTLTDAEQENYKTMIDKLIGENKKLEEELAKLKATRSQATKEGRVRRTRTLDNLDKSIAQKENKIRVNKATVTQKLNNEIPIATSTRLGQFITEMKLLNPFSRLTDFASNTIKLIDNIVSTPINMAVDQKTSRLLKTQPVYSSSYLAKDRWKNLLINSFEKMKADLKIVAAGGDVETIEKFGGAQGLGSKAAGLTDVPFKAIYHEDGKFLAADVKAREMLTEELGKGNFGKRDIDAKRAEILENIDQHPDIIMNAEEYALNETFNNHNWVSETNKALKGTVFKSPNARLAYDEAIGRFSKVITNVATDVADRTGLGVARGIYNIADAIKSGKNLTTAERMAINKMITKGMIGVPLMYLGIKNWDKVEGEIRGIQQKYIDYGDLGKLGGPIAIFLHGASIGRAMNTLSTDKVKDFVIASSLRLPFNTPFVSNVADISDVLDNPTPQAITKYAAKKTANTFIPAIVREIATRMDTEKGIQTGMELEREKSPKGAGTAEIFKGEFMSKIPGLRQQLPLKGSGRKPATSGETP